MTGAASSEGENGSTSFHQIFSYLLGPGFCRNERYEAKQQDEKQTKPLQRERQNRNE
jgi:hypothetical protein